MMDCTPPTCTPCHRSASRPCSCCCSIPTLLSPLGDPVQGEGEKIDGESCLASMVHSNSKDSAPGAHQEGTGWVHLWGNALWSF